MASPDDALRGLAVALAPYLAPLVAEHMRRAPALPGPTDDGEALDRNRRKPHHEKHREGTADDVLRSLGCVP